MKQADFLYPTGRELSRRDLLHGASVGIGASMLGVLSPARSLAEQGQQHYPTLGIRKPSLASIPIAWSNNEFHRRWNALRKRMNEAKLDCLIVPQHSHTDLVVDYYKNEADVYWLAGYPATWVVFPIEGKITVIGGAKPHRGVFIEKRPVPGIIMTTLFADNSPDIELWPGPAPWSSCIIDVLRERKMEQARIGVGSLGGEFRGLDGSVSYTALDRIRKAFPQAQFEDAVDMLWQVKLVNSAEEIAVFEHIAAVSEAGLLAMFKTAHPGAVNRDVWLSMYGAMLECSGSRPQHLVISTQEFAGANVGSPLPDTIDSGQILGQECAGCVLGYGAQVNHSVLIGSEGPADWPAAARNCIDVFHALLDRIAPGKSFKEVGDFAREKQLLGGVNFHFSGYGDLPRFGPRLAQGTEDAVFQPGMVFDLKPAIGVKGTPILAQFGDPI
ncbi:MAG: M24 family metallopeptidase, partial [Terriglobia bacterium]